MMSDPNDNNQPGPSTGQCDDESSHDRPKKRKIHMDHLDCRDFTENEGGDRLKNPNAVSFSSRDPNVGLYPRVSRKNPGPAAMGNGFKTASEVLNPKLPFLDSSQSQASTIPSADSSEDPQSNLPSWWKPKKPKSKLPAQSNTLDRYCVKKTQSSIIVQSSQTIQSSQTVQSSFSSSQTFISSQSSSRSSSVSSSPSSSQTKTTLMYKPIRKMEEGSGSIFYDGSPTKSDSVSKKLFDAQKTKPSTKPKKSRKPPPKFNRDNTFLYSQGPTVPIKSDSSTFGLLGDAVELSSDEEEDICWFDYLPVGVMENILCRLPLIDLCLNVNTVCKGWNEIISNEKFVPWKKRYLRMKKSHTPTLSEVSKIMIANDMQFGGPQTFLPGLIRYMKEFGPSSGRANMLDCLKSRHPKYQWAVDLLAERFQDCFFDKDEASPWSVVTVLVTVLSERVGDVEQVLSALLGHPSSQCIAAQVLEVLYVILCFLLMFKKTRASEVWNGMHYRLFYALYLFENESSCTLAELDHVFKDSSGQQSLMRYSKRDSSVQYTHEQLRICSYSVQPEDVVKIVAFAGTGKTTTLVRYTQLRPSKRFLLIVYNKAIKEHASSHFPGNVTCKTGHGLAFGYVGRRFGARPGKLGNLRVYPLTQVLHARKGESLFIQAKFVMDTIHTFLASADDEIEARHVPTEHVDDNGKRVQVDPVMQGNLISDAQKVWVMMQDLKNTRIPMTHDGYLKLYQLSRPRLNNYDVILIDEAQDLTPAIADILLSQRQPKILVGDPHQQIYAFRGAVNAMQLLPATHTFYLTQSFRFGPEIAFAAATCLEMLKGEKEKTLVGNKHPGDVSGSVSGQVAVITRTNFHLFASAVDTCTKEQEDSFKVAFAGGIQNFGLDMIMDIYLLMLPPEERQGKGEIKNKLVKSFHFLSDLEKYATKTMDGELLGKIKIVKVFNTKLPHYISKIKSRLTADENTADVIFSTAHKAKGLEFSTVKLTDDFTVFADDAVGMKLTEDEFNLLYVAITRAKRRLIMTRTVRKLLQRAGERLQYPDYTKPLASATTSTTTATTTEAGGKKQEAGDADGGQLTCVLTDREFTPNALTLTQRQITLSNNTVISSGPICPSLVTQEMPGFMHILGVVQDKAAQEQQQQQEEQQQLEQQWQQHQQWQQQQQQQQ